MKNNTKKTLSTYWQYSKKYKISLASMLLAITGAAAMSAITPLYFKRFFDILTSQAATNTIAAGLISTLVIIAGLELVQWLFWRVAGFTASYFESSVMNDLLDYCFAYLHKHSFTFFNNNFVGSLVKKVKWFAGAFETVADQIIFNILPLIVNVAIIGFVLFQRSKMLGSGILLWVAVFLAVNWFFTKYKLKYDIQRSQLETSNTGILADTITNSSTVKLFNGYDREVEKFNRSSDDVRRLRRLTWNMGNVFEAIQGFLMVSLEIGTFYLAIRLWQRGLLTVGDFVLIQAYLINIFNRVWDFGRMIRNIYERLADAEEMTVVLNTPHGIIDVKGAKTLQATEGKIEFQGVDFYYKETRMILQKFNLKIKPRERLALIGPSGAGKTTVVRLLLRMHELTAGRILIDGADIAKVTQESLWHSISMVPQDPILFHRTLMENIRYGRPEATDEEVMAAAQAANCHQFISEFSEGYNTYVGERGVKLSGGERQRVAIARAILRNSPILLLDEATSSLDSASEGLIQQALDKLMREKTVIVIAHRLSTIRKMDRIIVVDEGRIIEEGTHESLSHKIGGIYHKLWQLQAGGFIK